MAVQGGNSGQGRSGPQKGGTDREARLKAALKANLARRKAQARSRAADPDGPRGTERDAQDEKGR